MEDPIGILKFVFLFFHTAIRGIHRRGIIFCFYRIGSSAGERFQLEVKLLGRENIYLAKKYFSRT